MNTKFKVKAAEFPVKDLHLHAGANRELRPTRVRWFEKNMDLDALGRFAIWRDGRNFYVVDGQHRKIALEGLGLGDWKVRCDIYEGMSFAEACELFLKLNNSLTVGPFDKFDKGVKAGRRECVETLAIVEKAGLRVANQVGDGKLTAVAAAVDTWKLDQGEALAQSLRWGTEAWGLTAEAAEGQIVRGLGLVAQRYNGDIDSKAFIQKLAKYPGGPRHLIGAAKARREFKGGTVARNVAALAVDLYNKGRRSGQLSPL
jgi:hypothetical protein